MKYSGIPGKAPTRLAAAKKSAQAPIALEKSPVRVLARPHDRQISEAWKAPLQKALSQNESETAPAPKPKPDLPPKKVSYGFSKPVYKVRASDDSMERRFRNKEPQFSTLDAERIIREKRDNLQSFNQLYDIGSNFSKRQKEKEKLAPKIEKAKIPRPNLNLGSGAANQMFKKPGIGKGIHSQKFDEPKPNYDRYEKVKSSSVSRIPYSGMIGLEHSPVSQPKDIASTSSNGDNGPINFNSFGPNDKPSMDRKGSVDKKREVSHSQFDHLRRVGPAPSIQLDGREVIKVLGQGSFSTIYLVFCAKTEEYQAVKVFKNRADDIDNEFGVLRQLDHPNIIKAIEISNEPILRKRILVMEFAKGRTLKEIQLLNNPQIFSEEATIRLFEQILNGVAYMHDQGIAHCDLKMENIIFSAETGQIKIIDFGFARHGDRPLENVFCGSMGYMSPQLLRKGKYDLFKSDVWALGIILFKMLFNFFPFRGKNEIEILMRIERNNVSLPSNIRVSQKIMKFLNFVMNPKEAARPTSQEALTAFRAAFK